MMRQTYGFARGALLMSLLATSACLFGDDSRRDYGYGDGVYVAEPTAAVPLLVEVDTNQTMTVDGGKGVGVFVEYASGGSWSVFWTCDTLLTGQRCDFDVVASVAPGLTIRNIDTRGVGDGVVSNPASNVLEVSGTAGAGVPALYFATDPGAVLTLDARVGGIRSGAFFFFVQNGRINGDFAGSLSNPLQLQGSVP